MKYEIAKTFRKFLKFPKCDYLILNDLDLGNLKDFLNRHSVFLCRYQNIILIGVFIGAGSACQNAPDAPIPQEKLINVLYDIHTSEGLLESESQNVRDSMSKIYYAQIFQKYGVTQIDFDSTMAIYTRNPTQMDTVYNRLLRIVKADRDTLIKH